MRVLLTVIIPSVCTQARRRSLIRAIASAKASAPPGTVKVVVVANGPGVAEEVFEVVRALPEVRTLRLEEGSLPKAQLAGRKEVGTPFYAFLDDDDELLPDSNLRRLQALAETEEADLAITNGWREVEGRRQLVHPTLQAVAVDPLGTLLDRNWLASCAAVFRTATVGCEFFESPQPYAEWTWLGYQLCQSNKRVIVIDEPGYLIHDTPGSLSKSCRYVHAYVGLFDRMLAENPSPWVREIVQRKRCAALHQLADQWLAEGRVSEAWRFHCASLRPWRFGLRYLSFGRRFIYARARGAWR